MLNGSSTTRNQEGHSPIGVVLPEFPIVTVDVYEAELLFALFAFAGGGERPLENPLTQTTAAKVKAQAED